MTTGHSSIGGSSAKRWINCPGSVQLCAGITAPPPKDYALEGTAAHSFAEACLKHGYEKVAGMTKDTLIAHGFITEEESKWIDKELKTHVKIYFDTVMDCVHKAHKSAIFEVEKGFDLKHLHPDLYGTNDALIGEFMGTLTVFDLKYGKGNLVDVKENYQLMYYALGALAKYDWCFHDVKMVIVQPRAYSAEGAIRSHTMTVEDLVAWGENVLQPAARKTASPSAPLVPGAWCHENFCPAISGGQTCPAVMKEAYAVAQIEFSDVSTAEDICFPEPSAMAPVDVAKVLTFAPLLSAWSKGVVIYAQSLMEQGLSVPGFKLIAKRSIRRWKNPEQTAELLILDHREDQLFEPKKLKSVAQMEKAIGKEGLTDLWEQPDNGVKIAPESHKSQAVKSSAELDFEKI